MNAWYIKKGLKLNANKWNIISFGKQNIAKAYCTDDTSLSTESVIRDLGTWVNIPLSLDHHVATLVRNSFYISELIAKGILSKNKEVTVPLYFALVKPIIEYNILFDMYRNTLIIRLEKSKRFLMKNISYLKNLSYQQKMKSLSLYSVSYRLLLEDLCLASHHPYLILLDKSNSGDHTQNRDLNLHQDKNKTKWRDRFITHCLHLF